MGDRVGSQDVQGFPAGAPSRSSVLPRSGQRAPLFSGPAPGAAPRSGLSMPQTGQRAHALPRDQHLGQVRPLVSVSHEMRDGPVSASGPAPGATPLSGLPKPQVLMMGPVSDSAPATGATPLSGLSKPQFFGDGRVPRSGPAPGATPPLRCSTKNFHMPVSGLRKLSSCVAISTVTSGRPICSACPPRQGRVGSGRPNPAVHAWTGRVV